jgi:SAM-dependent methyltransferase
MEPRWTEDPATWPAPSDRAREHWLIEQELREELLRARPEDRPSAYKEVYERLYREVPWHEANTRSEAEDESYEDLWFRLYRPLMKDGDVLVDLGCGRGSLLRRFAGSLERCIGIDVADAMIDLSRSGGAENVEFVAGSVVTPPLAPESADVVVSRQVMEHLHPDDVPGHLRAVRRLLRPGGRFLIETPSRLTGPWDISRRFTEAATGFHLREYTIGELTTLLRDAGFRRVRSPAVPSRVLVRLGPLRSRAYVPGRLKGGLEKVLERLPQSRRRAIAPLFVLRDVMLVADR